MQEVQKERTVILPDILRRMMKQEELKELEWAVENEGVHTPNSETEGSSARRRADRRHSTTEREEGVRSGKDNWV